MSILKEGNFSLSKINEKYFSNPNLGSLKTKLHDQTKWHRRYCTLDWDKSILFLATRADTRYRDWIKLLPNIFVNDSDCTAPIESNANAALYIIEIKGDSFPTTTHAQDMSMSILVFSSSSLQMGKQFICSKRITSQNMRIG